jgi:hypothetical protein
MKSTSILLDNCEVQEIDGILIVRFGGDYTLELAVELQAITNAVAARDGYRLLLFDLRGLRSVTPAARRFLIEDHERERKPSFVAIFGASFAIRTLATMVIRAMNALTKVPVVLEFFDTEERAQGWLQNERNRLRTSDT